jgi:hypothetical protein
MSLSAKDGDEKRSEEGEDDGGIQFDDFGDQFIGGSIEATGAKSGRETESFSSRGQALLKSRMQKVTERQEQLSRENWRKGNWNVRGLSLDPESSHFSSPDEAVLPKAKPSEQDLSSPAEMAQVHVCLVVVSGDWWPGSDPEIFVPHPESCSRTLRLAHCFLAGRPKRIEQNLGWQDGREHPRRSAGR